MDFILNDKSLCGQFNSVSSFFDSLKNNVQKEVKYTRHKIFIKIKLLPILDYVI